MTNPLEKKFNTWGEWLMANDPNSCNQVLGEILWDRATASVFDKLASENTLLSVPLVNNFASRHYFQIQSLRIRRLIDGGGNVSSLGRILTEMRDSIHSINRRNLLLLRKVEDLKSARDLEEEFISKQKPNSGWFRDYTETLTYKESVHRQIDNIFNNGNEGTINQEVLKKLEDKLANARSIAIYVNKMVAHSVIPSDRQKVDENHLEISSAKIDKAIEELVGVFSFLTLFIKEASVISVPLGWDTAVNNMTKEQVDIVSHAWGELSARTDTWRKWGADLLAKKQSSKS